MAYTTIDDPSAHHQSVAYTGAGNNSSVTFGGNSDLQLDWLWVKRRDSSGNSKVFDTSRGIGSGAEPYLTTVSTEQEQTYAYLTSVDSDGFTWDTVDNSVGTSSNTYVAWGWKANGGTATATGSESGSNPAYSVQANTTAGFSIVTYTGTGSNGTVPHGLGVKPDWYIIKNRDNTNADDGRWMVWHKSLEELHNYYSFIFLHLNNSRSEGTTVVNATPNTTTFALGDDGMINNDGEKYVAYCFAEKQGYSKFGSYTGNGNADGAFVYTGFKPAWVMFKRTDSTNNWNIFDSKRDVDNQVGNVLYANLSNAEEADASHSSANDFLSNGFKLRETGNAVNGSGATYIYMAFAEHPFVSSKGVPVTAK
jgi:hypothetical protein